MGSDGIYVLGTLVVFQMTASPTYLAPFRSFLRSSSLFFRFCHPSGKLTGWAESIFASHWCSESHLAHLLREDGSPMSLFIF
jgi:hypothetical protein